MARDYKRLKHKSTDCDPEAMDKLIRAGWAREAVGARFGISSTLVRRRILEWKRATGQEPMPAMPQR